MARTQQCHPQLRARSKRDASELLANHAKAGAVARAEQRISPGALAVTASRIALDGGALTILPLVMIAQSLQFRRDRMFEFGAKTPSRHEVRSAVFVSLVISILAYSVMSIGWAASIVELDRGHGNSVSNVLILCGFIAAIVALTRGGVHALVLSHFERGNEVERGLDAQSSQEVAAEDRLTREAAARTEADEARRAGD